jgi:hypothetical protein
MVNNSIFSVLKFREVLVINITEKINLKNMMILFSRMKVSHVESFKYVGLYNQNVELN